MSALAQGTYYPHLNFFLFLPGSILNIIWAGSNRVRNQKMRITFPLPCPVFTNSRFLSLCDCWCRTRLCQRLRLCELAKKGNVVTVSYNASHRPSLFLILYLLLGLCDSICKETVTQRLRAINSGPTYQRNRNKIQEVTVGPRVYSAVALVLCVRTLFNLDQLSS